MGSFRFRRRVRIAKGLTLNFNKKSVSLTGGVRGAHVTKSVGGKSNYSVGVPGTGLWYRGTLDSKSGQPAPKASVGKTLATAPPGTRTAKAGNFLVWVGGLVWLLPVAWVIALIAGGTHNFGVAYGVLVAVWTVLSVLMSVRRARAKTLRDAPGATPVLPSQPLLSAGPDQPPPSVTPSPPAPPAFTEPEQELRKAWTALLSDGLWTQQDEDDLNEKLRELNLDADELGLNDSDIGGGRFADLIWRSRIAMAATGRLPALESPSLIHKKGELVHFEGPANLMKRTSASGLSFYRPDDDGTFSVTSERFVFSGQRTSLVITYRRLIGLTFGDDGEQVGSAVLHNKLVIHDSEERTSCLFMGLGNADLAAAVIRSAASAESD